jgi:hypothetical protein
MIGLKSYLPMLAPCLALSTSALFERQRALVRLGLLKREPGSGPGSGVRASPESVAMLLLSVLATDNLSEIDRRVADLANTKAWTHRSRRRCSLTRQPTFFTALTSILANPKMAQRVQGIEVHRKRLTAHLFWGIQETWLTNFDPPEDLDRHLGLSVQASINGAAIHAIAVTLSLALKPETLNVIDLMDALKRSVRKERSSDAAPPVARLSMDDQRKVELFEELEQAIERSIPEPKKGKRR